VRFALLVPLIAGCVVIRAPLLDERPRWRITGGDQLDTDCVSARALIRKSGKQGIGMAVQLRSRMDCTFAPTAVTLELRGAPAITLATPAPVVLHGRSQLYAWLQLAFDNNAAWNAGANDAVLALAYMAGGQPGTWKIAMHQQ
jgi:hypothetical protein